MKQIKNKKKNNRFYSVSQSLRFWFTAVSGKQKQLNQINLTYLGLNPCLFEVVDIDFDLEKITSSTDFYEHFKDTSLLLLPH
jgi:hypothetical protein